MSDFTIFAMNCENEHLGDALLVSAANLAAAVDALVEYWEEWQEREGVEDDFGVRCEVHHDSVSDGRGMKPLPWQPGDRVIDPEFHKEEI
jgi:hypothetical protein